jgi:spore coat protein CotF
MNNSNTYYSDKDILTDILTSIKSLASLYHNFSIEASNDLVFDISSDLREEIFDEQRDCYNLLYSKGWYSVEEQPSNKITKDVEKYNKSKNELDSYSIGQ